MNLNNIAMVAASIAPLVFAFAAKAQSETEEQMRNMMSYPLEDIEKTKAMVDKYTPEGQLYLVNEAGGDWLRRAISDMRREQWIKDKEYWSSIGGETPARKKLLYGAFDDLKASLEKKLPNYLPKDKYFAFHTDEDEKLIRAAISNLDEATVFKIGTAQKDWTIDKGGSSIPVARYKQGYIYAKYQKSNSGHNYCQLLHVNIIEDYAGGGTYGPAYGRLIWTEIVGCPKK